MTQEELRELREVVMGEFNTDYGGGNVGLTPAGDKLVELINEKITAIARIDSTDSMRGTVSWDAEVQRAIAELSTRLEQAKESGDGDHVGHMVKIGTIKTAITALQAMKPVDGSTSDGYHTFNDLYHHRAILFACLSRCYPDKAWKSLKHHDGTMFDGNWFICGIETPQGQYTYHFDTKYWPMFAGKVLDRAPEWDGHKPEDVIRLMSLYPGQSRQVGDDVIEAITVLTEIRRNRMNVGFTIFPNWAQPIKAIEQSIDLAIRILSAYRQPVSPKFVVVADGTVCPKLFTDSQGAEERRSLYERDHYNCVEIFTVWEGEQHE